jgi:aminomuconate-semialdehyde/2-hydroxymuconate-6-semialdehyde dehydrogenase
VSCISPWNLPLYLLSWKIAPALAAGNTVVAKPSEITPMTAYLLCEIAQSIGLPKGVLNIIHGTGPKAGDPLTRHPDIKAVSFTGSTMTGSLVAQNAAKGFKKVSLEMGGKNPTIIFADANFDEAVDGAVKAAFSNQGQICLCGSRILIERSIYSQFKEAITAKTKTLRVGDPLDKGHHLGAVVSKTHYEKILGHIQIAKEEGGKILCGGEALHTDRGYFIAPTLIEGLDANCRTNQEEIFGPVATLIPFDNEDEALAIANGTRYGLSANIWTKDLTRAHRVSRRLDAGIVWVNTWLTRDLRTPFGGMKESGVGREGGIEALAFFSEVKNVCLKL